MIRLHFENIQTEFPDLPDPRDYLLRIVADFSVVINGNTLLEPIQWFPIVELASHLHAWSGVDRAVRSDFEYDSDETDELGWLWIRRAHEDLWQVGSVKQVYAETTMWPGGEIDSVVRGFIDNVVHDSRHHLGLDVRATIDRNG